MTLMIDSSISIRERLKSRNEGLMLKFPTRQGVRLVGFILLVCCQPIFGQASGPAVTLTEDDANYTLANGTITAVVAKATGDLMSLQYKGLETIGTNQGRIVPAAFT